MIATNFQVVNEFNPALLRAFNDSRMKPDMARAINRIMATWVGFAMNKMYSADKAAIKAHLEARASRAKYSLAQKRVTTKTGKESGAKRYQALKDSLAAHIVIATNYTGRLGSKKKGFRSASAWTASGTDFYSLVGKYIANRQYSTGYLRSGMRPALNTFRVRLGLEARDAKYKRGEVGRAKKAEPSERIMAAEAENWAGGILEKFPHVFTQTLPEIEAKVTQWIAENIADRAKEQGLVVTRTA